MSRAVHSSGTVPPLESQAPSDHRVVHVTFDLPRREAFEWVSYSYSYFTEEAQAVFGRWIVMHQWMEVITEQGSNAKAAAYQKTIDWAMNEFFPL